MFVYKSYIINLKKTIVPITFDKQRKIPRFVQLVTMISKLYTKTLHPNSCLKFKFNIDHKLIP